MALQAGNPSLRQGGVVVRTPTSALPNELYRVNERANALRDRYDAYPDSPAGFDTRQAERDTVVDEVYAESGALPGN